MITLKDDVSFTRNKLAQYLEQNHIQTRNLFAGNILRHPLFQDLQHNKDYKIIRNLINTDKIMNNSLWIGVYPGMRIDSIDYMIKMIKTIISEQ